MILPKAGSPKLVLSIILIFIFSTPIISNGQCPEGEKELVGEYSSIQNGTELNTVGPINISEPWILEWNFSVNYLNIRIKRSNGEGFKDKGKGKDILPNNDGILVTENVSEGTSRMYRSGSFTLHLFGANENYRDGEWEWKIRAYECQSSEQTGQQG